MTLLPMRSHLPPWQAPHLAWLASQGRKIDYAVPDGIEPRRAILTGADLRGVNLSIADLRWADLRWADLTGADLRFADLRGADLTAADLTEANLSWASLSGADLSYAHLTEAGLDGADLSGADLTWAVGIASIGPIGCEGRTVYAVAHHAGPMIDTEFGWCGVEDTIASIEADYADDPAARDRYVAAVRAVAALVMP